MHIYRPYTYLVGWSQHNKWYYGVRFAKGCNPSDFWVSYFTSSKYVKEFREAFGEPDIVQIRKTFNNREEAISWEQRVLHRINALDDPKWINCGIAGYSNLLYFTEEHKKK